MWKINQINLFSVCLLTIFFVNNFSSRLLTTVFRQDSCRILRPPHIRISRRRRSSRRCLRTAKAAERVKLYRSYHSSRSEPFSNANLQSSEILDELVRKFIEKIVIRRADPNGTDNQKPKYVMEIWLYETENPVNLDLSPRLRKGMCAQTKRQADAACLGFCQRPVCLARVD